MWPEGADGTDINTCARSNSAQCLTNGDDSGSVNLFSYPCLKPKVRLEGEGGREEVNHFLFTAYTSCSAM